MLGGFFLTKIKKKDEKCLHNASIDLQNVLLNKISKEYKNVCNILSFA